MGNAYFLARHPDIDASSSNETIAISYMIQNLVNDNGRMGGIMSMNDIENHQCDRWLLVTRRMTKENVALPSIYHSKVIIKDQNKLIWLKKVDILVIQKRCKILL